MQKNIAWLSSLRGIGCLFVLVAHLGASSTNYGMYFNGWGKKGVKEVRKSQKVVNQYYKSMMKSGYMEPQFTDNKK